MVKVQQSVPEDILAVIHPLYILASGLSQPRLLSTAIMHY
jgi:hypothetical protein